MPPAALPIAPLILIAGTAQLVLVAASVAIPRVLRWRDDLARTSPLLRRLFWVYAGYIWVTNLCFGLLSVAAPRALVDSSLLAACVVGYMGMYWAARLVIQFALFRTVKPNGRLFRVAEAALVLLFVFLTSVYTAAAVLNLQTLTL